MPEPIIAVKNLQKRYGNFDAVRGLTFSIQQGEIVGLLGPNGAGKTTTLEIIETLKQKSSGSVQVCGYDIDSDAAAIKKVIGVQLQSSGYYPGLNLTQLLYLFAGLYNTTINPLQILSLVNLADKAKAKVKELSGGQRQRFSIATTLVNNPKVIFLDEPTTGLDPQARRSLWELIKAIRATGTTIVLTTHYMDEAEYLCDRIAIMDQGKLIAYDSPDALIDQLLQQGFERKKDIKAATLEDVFIALTGHQLAPVAG
ncbi:MAG: ABC transporter ATP-binding protein [Bacteroidetes bacterium]|nr:ABC transporter ATP-binding protein [Bacteroidota bacterium]